MVRLHSALAAPGETTHVNDIDRAELAECGAGFACATRGAHQHSRSAQRLLQLDAAVRPAISNRIRRLPSVDDTPLFMKIDHEICRLRQQNDRAVA
jgi:hypothetical protein